MIRSLDEAKTIGKSGIQVKNPEFLLECRGAGASWKERVDLGNWGKMNPDSTHPQIPLPQPHPGSMLFASHGGCKLGHNWDSLALTPLAQDGIDGVGKEPKPSP